MTESDVRKVLDSHGLSWDKFCEFMIGQTVTSDSHGNTLYFQRDVNNFIAGEKTGTLNFFD